MINNGFGSREKPPKPSILISREGNFLIINVFDGKRWGILKIKIPPDETNFQTPQIFSFFLRREFGGNIEKENVYGVIKRLMGLIDKQEKKDG